MSNLVAKAVDDLLKIPSIYIIDYIELVESKLEASVFHLSHPSGGAPFLVVAPKLSFLMCLTCVFVLEENGNTLVKRQNDTF